MRSRITSVDVSAQMISAHLADGRIISVPLAWSWRLSEATPAQHANWQLTGDRHGVHWPDIDEDISADGMLHGAPARRPRTKAVTKATSSRERRRTPSKQRSRTARG